MAKELVTKEAQVLTRMDRYVTLTAMQIPDGLEFDQWAKLGEGLGVSRKMVKNQSLAFYVGDWLNYGETTYADISDRYAEAIKQTGYDQGTLYNCKYVSGAIPAVRRREELSWSHHQAVASLSPSDQDFLLESAVADGMTAAQLRKMVAAMKNGATEAEAELMPEKGEQPEATQVDKRAEAIEALKRDVPAAQQMAEDFFTLANAFLTENLADGKELDAKTIANFQATSKGLSEVTNRIFKDLAELT